MRIEDFLRYFDRVKRSGDGFTVRCPGHDDKHNSLSIGAAPDEKILVKCHAGCETEHIVRVLGLTMAALMPERAGEQEIATYDYRDEKGGLLYQVVRYYPKTFKQRRPDGGGGWYWKIEGVRRVPYRLPEILKASMKQVIYITEGEKDADRIARLKYPDGTSYVATTNAGGAGKWQDSFSAFFRDRIVAIIPDNDDTGEKHAQQVKASLERAGADLVQIVRFPGAPKDISDWFMGDDATQERFDEITEGMFDSAVADRDAVEQDEREASAEEDDRIYWSPYSLTHSRSIRPPVGFIHTSIFPRRTVSLIMGPSSSGKSYFVMYLGALLANGAPLEGIKVRQANVLFLSFEMEGPELLQRSNLVWRSDQMLEWETSRFQFRWNFSKKGETIDLGGQVDNDSVDRVVKIIDEATGPTGPVDVVFVDSLSEIHHTDENSNQTMGIVMENLKLVAKRANAGVGVALIVIHHTGKPNEFRTGFHKGRGASCIPAKANDIFMVEPPEPVDPDAPPLSIVTFAKTRTVPLSDRGPLQPFTFSQANDPERGPVTLTDGRTVPATQFTTAPYVRPVTGIDLAAKTARDTVANLIANADERARDGRVFRADLIGALRDSLHWSQRKTETVLARAVGLGLLEKTREGRETAFSMPAN